MNILVLDTSTSMAAVAVAKNEKVAAESLFNSDRTLSARLIPEIERLLAISGMTIADIDLFAASIGPGSFTGVRGGVATIQGLALAGGRLCAGYSSLAMLAMNFPYSSCPVCTMFDARKGEVYAALHDPFEHIPGVLIPDCAVTPEHLLDRVCAATRQPVIFAGEGALRYRELIAGKMGDRALFPPHHLHTARAANGVVLALEQFRRGEAKEPPELLPHYLRASDAELMKAKAS